MQSDQALCWLRQVKGQLYRNRPHASAHQAWVAVVRAPQPGSPRGKLIIALGASMEEAASAAEAQWQRLWGSLGRSH